MASVDMQYIRQRRREIRQTIHRSSPVLIYSGPLGIAIIAASKSAMRNRIGKILDRMAIVSRGELTACDLVHKVAAGEAYAIAHALSRGDVLGHEPAQAVGALLSRHYHVFQEAPVAVESCLVQLNDTPETDYLSYIHPDGSMKLFDQILYLGSVGGSPESDGPQDTLADDAQEHDPKGHDSDHGAQERLEELNHELRDRYVGYSSVAALVADLERAPKLAPLFTAGKRRDIVVLDRDALARREFGNIFKRLTL